MAERNYDALFQLQFELAQFSGYLDTEGILAQQQVRGAYRAERNRVAFELLEGYGAEEAIGFVRSDFAAMAQRAPDYRETYDFLADDLIYKLVQESRSGKWLRRLKFYAGPVILAILAVVYFGLWFHNDLTIDQPIESRAGIIQRAQAFEKARQFDELNGGRGGTVKMVLLKPFEPDQKEIDAAYEFGSLVVDGYFALEKAGLACGGALIFTDDLYVDRQLETADEVAAYILDPQTQWLDPPTFTVLQPISERFPCAAGDQPAASAAPEAAGF